MKWSVWLVLGTVLILVAGVGCAVPPPEPEVGVEEEVTVPVEEPAAEEAKEALEVYGLFSTPIEEPWVTVIHEALLKAQEEGKIVYTFTDNLGYGGDMERVAREVAEQRKPDAIFGDAFGNEEAVRRVAADYPDIAFVFGSGLGPVEPNFSVFDNWIHEPAYLAGMLAGGLTKTGIIGVVGGYPVPEVNRIVNAFIGGVKEINPNNKVLVTFIDSWFDPAAAKEAALAFIDAGADVLYAERFGVIEAAAENGLWAIGQMTDQNELAPDYVVTSVVWNMTPTVEFVIDQISKGAFTAQDLKDFSMMLKGGASLAPFHGTEDKIPVDLVERVRQREKEILQGLFRVDVNEARPPASS